MLARHRGLYDLRLSLRVGFQTTLRIFFESKIKAICEWATWNDAGGE